VARNASRSFERRVEQAQAESVRELRAPFCDCERCTERSPRRCVDVRRLEESPMNCEQVLVLERESAMPVWVVTLEALGETQVVLGVPHLAFDALRLGQTRRGEVANAC